MYIYRYRYVYKYTCAYMYHIYTCIYTRAYVYIMCVHYVRDWQDRQMVQ